MHTAGPVSPRTPLQDGPIGVERLANKHDAGKSGVAVSWRAGRAWPAVPIRDRSARMSQNNVNRIMGAWTCDLHGHGAAAWLGREIAWQGRSLRGNDSVSMILLLGRSRGRLSAEPATPANAGGAPWFQCGYPWPGIAEFLRSSQQNRARSHSAHDSLVSSLSTASGRFSLSPYGTFWVLMKQQEHLQQKQWEKP